MSHLIRIRLDCRYLKLDKPEPLVFIKTGKQILLNHLWFLLEVCCLFMSKLVYIFHIMNLIYQWSSNLSSVNDSRKTTGQYLKYFCLWSWAVPASLFISDTAKSLKEPFSSRFKLSGVISFTSQQSVNLQPSKPSSVTNSVFIFLDLILFFSHEPTVKRARAHTDAVRLPAAYLSYLFSEVLLLTELCSNS